MGPITDRASGVNQTLTNICLMDFSLLINWTIPFQILGVSGSFGVFFHYTTGIYAEGYIVFVFPFVRSYIRLFVRTSVPFVELLQSFTLKFLKWGISQQPLIGKHSYLDHRYPGESAFIP